MRHNIFVREPHPAVGGAGCHPRGRREPLRASAKRGHPVCHPGAQWAAMPRSSSRDKPQPPRGWAGRFTGPRTPGVMAEAAGLPGPEVGGVPADRADGPGGERLEGARGEGTCQRQGRIDVPEQPRKTAGGAPGRRLRKGGGRVPAGPLATLPGLPARGDGGPAPAESTMRARVAGTRGSRAGPGHGAFWQ